MGQVDRSVMRLSISGTAGQGKTTLLGDFMDRWTMYNTPEQTYREFIKKETHSKQTNKETQWNILNFMVDQLQENADKEHIIYDRNPIDNLIYSMWCYHKEISDIDELFIEKCIPIVRESMKLLDIIFFIPITNVTQDTIQDDGTREADIEYIKEIDNIFKALHQNWMAGDTRFFPKEDRTAMIEIFGSPEERVKMIELYVNPDGNMFGDDESLVDTNEIYDEFGFSAQGSDTVNKYE